MWEKGSKELYGSNKARKSPQKRPDEKRKQEERKEGTAFALTNENWNPVQMNLETGEAEELTAEDQIADLLEEIKAQDTQFRWEIIGLITWLKKYGWSFIKENDRYIISGRENWEDIRYELPKDERMNHEAFKKFLERLFPNA